MNLETLKEMAFRHCEKVALAIVGILVILNVLGHMSGGDQAGGLGLGGPGGKGGAPPSGAIAPTFYQTTTPYTEVPEVAQPKYDPFWPPSTKDLLPPIVLKLDEPDATSKAVTVPGKVVGTPRKVDLTPDERKKLPEVSAAEAGKDSIVDVSVAPSGTELTVKGIDFGRWVAYKAQLEGGDWVRIFVRVRKPGQQDQYVVMAGRDATVQEEKLGIVEVSFLAPEPKPEETTGNVVMHFVMPSKYVVSRKGPNEEKATVIGEVTPGRATAGTEAPPAPGAPERPAGLPDLGGRGVPPPPGPPPRPRPGPAGPKPEKADRFSFVDRSVDPETLYVYTVVSVGQDGEGKPIDNSASPIVLNYKTKARFNFAFVGVSGVRAPVAHIIVMIGPKDDPEDMKEYRVGLGGLIGEQPGAQGAGVDPRYITGFVLVDNVPNGFTLVEQERMVPVKDPVTGQIKYVPVKTYWGKLSQYVIVRDRKDRLVRLWLEPRPKVTPRSRPGHTGVAPSTAKASNP